MLPHDLEVLALLRAQRILQEKHAVRLEGLGQLDGLRVGDALVRIMAKLNLVAQHLPRICRRWAE